MDYAQYTVEDFLLDEQFRKWIYHPDEDNNAYWENWLSQNPKKSAELMEARNILLNLSMKDYRMTEREKRVLWEEIDKKTITEQLNVSETKVIPINPLGNLRTPETKKRNFQWLRVAAVLLVLMVASVLILEKYGPEQKEVAETMTQKATALGMKSEITLSDGTVVVLNSGSKLSYLPNFTDKSRVVYLEGEAYFDVAKDPKRPFTVHTGDVATTALGTEFNINGYQDQNNGIQIALVEGKVQVKSNHISEDFILSPGEMAHYGPIAKSMAIAKFDTKAVTAWKEGSLYFAHAHEAEVFKRIERWYGVDIHLTNASEKKWDYSAEFKGQNIHQVLTSLGFTMAFDYKVKNSNVYITYKNRQI